MLYYLSAVKYERVKSLKIMFLTAAIFWTIMCVVNAECPRILHTLSVSQGNLTRCITKNAVPVTMCMNCSSMHTQLLKSYDNLTAKCGSIYFDKDRINIIASTESLLTGLWSKAFCDDCSNNNNGAVFHDKFQNFNSCLTHAKNLSCERCKGDYKDLNDFYISLEQHNNGEVCYDLQDSMNRTRNIWSKELKCCRREKNMTLFATALGIISCLPLLFYGSAYMITKRQERNHGILNNDGKYKFDIIRYLKKIIII